MSGNAALQAAMRAAGMKQRELAERLNDELTHLTGHRGSIAERTVGQWVRAAATWPHERQRRALEAVFGCPIEGLGFVPRSAVSRSAKDQDVKRRAFIGASTVMAAATATPLAPLASRRTVGMSDVQRLRGELDRLVAADHIHGGTSTVEARAVELSALALDIQQAGSATQRVRSALYGVAAEYRSTAMWAAVDAREMERAQTHWQRAMPLAGMAGDPAGQWRTWSHASMLAHQRGRTVDSLAAADASRACSITRRDPLYRSLSFARQGLARATLGERTPALRLFDCARTAIEQADPGANRPSWIAFFDRAELAGLGCVMYLHLGAAQEAEAEAHRALTLLQPAYQRNRRYYMSQLARAQLAQGEIEQATATARRVGDVRSSRTRELMRTFTRELLTMAPDARQTRAWITHERETRQE